MSRITLPVFLLVVIGAGLIWFYAMGSGTFVSHSSNYVSLLNITKSLNGEIAGQYQEISLQNDGILKTETTSVTGVAGLFNMSLSFREIPFIPTGTTVLGRYDGSSLVLTFLGNNATPITQTFYHSTLAQFQNLTNDLRRQSNQILAHKVELAQEQKAIKQKNEFVAEINNLISRIADSTSQCIIR